MKHTEAKTLSNNTLLVAYFDGEKKNTIRMIEAKRSVFIKKRVAENITLKKIPLNLFITKSEENGISYESELLFGNKNFGKTKYFSGFSKPYIPEEDRRGLLPPELERINPTLLQIWNNPMAFKDLRNFVELFSGNYRDNPLDFTGFKSVQSLVKSDWNSMQLFVLFGESSDGKEESLLGDLLSGEQYQR